MKYNIIIRNIVLVGLFEPSLFDKFFFIKNNIFSEDDFLENTFFNQELTQIATKDLNIIIFPNQIVITASVPDGNVRIEDTLLTMIRAKELNITALGINFHWNILVEKDLTTVTRDLFYNENNKLISSFFNTDDSNYGLYVSKDIYNFRLKLEIKPQILQQNNVEAKVVSFAFNFHYNYKNIDDLVNQIGQYNLCLSESEKIMSIYEK